MTRATRLVARTCVVYRERWENFCTLFEESASVYLRTIKLRVTASRSLRVNIFFSVFSTSDDVTQIHVQHAHAHAHVYVGTGRWTFCVTLSFDFGGECESARDRSGLVDRSNERDAHTDSQSDRPVSLQILPPRSPCSGSTLVSEMAKAKSGISRNSGPDRRTKSI